MCSYKKMPTSAERVIYGEEWSSTELIKDQENYLTYCNIFLLISSRYLVNTALNYTIKAYYV